MDKERGAILDGTYSPDNIHVPGRFHHVSCLTTKHHGIDDSGSGKREVFIGISPDDYFSDFSNVTLFLSDRNFAKLNRALRAHRNANRDKDVDGMNSSKETLGQIDRRLQGSPHKVPPEE